MIKLAYVLVAILVLFPSFVAGVMTLYAVRAAHRIAREAPHDPGDTVYAFTNTLTFTPGKTEVDIYPRVWAAILVITGCVAWLVGVVVLLFVRHV
jgi:hypothetical protein